MSPQVRYQFDAPGLEAASRNVVPIGPPALGSCEGAELIVFKSVGEAKRLEVCYFRFLFAANVKTARRRKTAAISSKPGTSISQIAPT